MSWGCSPTASLLSAELGFASLPADSEAAADIASISRNCSSTKNATPRPGRFRTARRGLKTGGRRPPNVKGGC